MTMRNAAPIGVFDSGVGGLSVLRAIRAALPDEALLYCADSRYAPYGERDDAFIAARTLGIGRWLASRHVKAIVVACNTATAHTVSMLRERLQMPIIGVEPGIKPAALQSRTRVAGVLATASTLQSARFNALLAQYGGDCRFVCQAGHGLVDAIEAGDIGSPVVMQRLSACLQPILDAGADTLVLGCTHYPFLLDAVRMITADRLHIIDTGDAIARQLVRRLTDLQLLIDAGPAAAHAELTLAPAPLRLVTTGDAPQLTRIAWQLLGVDVAAEHVEIASEPIYFDAPA
ncbi:glutamate racemase [Mycetohabitans endofungorum]|uniref:glutamate racemase n=1 Tax=Mycetohabitans endofungorum TaxID=417203 RepID=UPI002B05BC0D|nr:glutamate racemase [Mycetohabitans endofungorum]